MSHVTVFWTQEILVGYVLEELCYRQLFVEWATAATNLPSFADGLNFPWTDIPIFAQGATGKKQKLILCTCQLLTLTLNKDEIDSLKPVAMRTVFMLFTISFKKVHYYQHLLLKLHAIYYKSLRKFIELLKPFKKKEICEYL